LLAVAVFPVRLAARTNETSVKDMRRWLYSIGLVIVSLTLYLTFSKGAWLVGLPTCIVVMALLYTHRNQRHHWRRAIVITVSCLAIIALTLIPLSQTERFRTTFDFNQGSTGFIRLKLWQASLTMLREHWPLGVGLDNFLYQYRTRYILPEAWEEHDLSHPHNLILDFGARLGIGGIVLLLWFQAAFWINAWRLYQKTPNPLGLGLIGSMIAFLSHGFVDNSFFLVDLAFTFFLTVGVMQKLVETPSYPFKKFML
jgi:O-antigen ligase